MRIIEFRDDVNKGYSEGPRNPVSSLSLGSEDSDLGFGLDETLVLTFWAGPLFGVHMKL